MPRTFLNTVRGYKEQTFWGNEAGQDSQNVMKTRSGLTIKTVPSVRRSNSRTNVRLANSQQANNTPDSPKWSKISQMCQTSHKSMSCLSFVTRYNMLINGTNLDFSDSLNKSEAFSPVKNENDVLDRDNIEDLTTNFRAQLNEIGLYARDDDQHIPQDCRVQASEHELPADASLYFGDKNHCAATEFTRDATKENGIESAHDDVSTHNEKVPVDIALTENQSNPVSSAAKSSDEHINSTAAGTNQPIHSKTKVLLTISSSTKSSPAQAFRLGDKHLVQAQFSNGKPLLYNNIPVMVVNRIPTVPEVQPIPVSPWKLDTRQSNPGTLSKPSLHVSSPSNGRVTTPNFSPGRQELEPDVDKGINVLDTDEDDSSDTCSQGSQDSAISDFDLSIFQMESHAFAHDANGNQIHKCKICDRVFTIFSAFKAHVNSHVKVKNRCTICGKIFSRSWLLKGHMRTHTGEKPFECPHPSCHKRFADKSNLRSHQLIHTITDKTYICPKCHRAFAQKRYLHKHRLEVCKV